MIKPRSRDNWTNQKGLINVLLLVGVIGVMVFLIVTSIAPLRNSLLSQILPKSPSYAAGAINEALDFCINGSSSSYPLDARLVSPGGDVQTALNTYKKVRLVPGNYEGPSKWVLSSNMQLYGIRGEYTTLVPKIEIQPGSTNVIVSNVSNYSSMDFPASNLVTKNNCFVGVLAPLNINQATLEDNIFLDITGLFNFDNRSGGYMKNNRFIRTRTLAPGNSVTWYGDAARKSDNNVLMFYNNIYKRGLYIDNQNNFSIVGMDAEGWNRETTNPPALLQTGGMNHMRILGWSGGLNTVGIPSLFDIGASFFQYLGGYVDGGQTPDTIMRTTNLSSAFINVTNNNSIQNQGTGNLFKAFTDGGTAVSGNSNTQALKQLFIDQVNTRSGDMWERPVFSTIPDPAPDWQSYRNTATDSTAYIQGLVNSANPVAFLPAGKYVVFSPIVIPLGKGLIGAGADKTAIIAKNSNTNILQGQGSAAPTRVYIANMTLQGGNNGLIFSAANGMKDAQFNAAFFSNLTFRNNQTAFFIDNIWGLDNHLMDHLNFYQNETALKQRARAGAADTAGNTWSMGYQDKNLYYHNQYVENTTVFDLQGERANVNNAWLNSLFLDNINMGSFKNYINLTFANSDFINNGNGGNPLLVNNSYDARINCISCNFQADARGQIMLPSDVTCEGCVFNRGNSTTATVLKTTGNNKNFFYNTRSTMPIGNINSGILINSSFLENQFNQQGVSVINGNATTFLAGVSNPKPQLLFGSNLTGLAASPSPVNSLNPDPSFSTVYGDGLTASYYATNDLSGTPVIVRTDSTIDSDFGSSSPDNRLAIDNFSAKWDGFIEPSLSTDHTFYLSSDDGARLYINNQLVIDNWGPTPNGLEEVISAPISLASGTKVPISIEYQELGGPGSIHLSWSSTAQTKQIIPKANLFTSNQIVSVSPAAASPSQSPQIVGDIIVNGKVDIFDYNQMVSDFGKTGTNLISDIYKLGSSLNKVDVFDYNELLTNYGK